MSLHTSVMLLAVGVFCIGVGSLLGDREHDARLDALESGTNLTVEVVDEQVSPTEMRRSYVIVPKGGAQ